MVSEGILEGFFKIL